MVNKMVLFLGAPEQGLTGKIDVFNKFVNSRLFSQAGLEISISCFY